MSDTEQPLELAEAVRQLRARGFTRHDIGWALVVGGGCLLAGSEDTDAVSCALRTVADKMINKRAHDPRRKGKP